MSRKSKQTVEALLRSEAGQLAMADGILTEALGDAIRQAMQKRRVSLYMLAKKLGVTEPKVRSLLHGRVHDLESYSAAFNALRVMPRVTTVLLRT